MSHTEHLFRDIYSALEIQGNNNTCTCIQPYNASGVIAMHACIYMCYYFFVSLMLNIYRGKDVLYDTRGIKSEQHSLETANTSLVENRLLYAIK